MERGIGGRIEDAFQAAKDRGEAAFVTFVTAGYPTAKGAPVHRRVDSMNKLCLSLIAYILPRPLLTSCLYT